MVEESVFIHLLSDDKSLACYFNGKPVLFNKIKQQLTLINRSQNTRIPNHFYKLKEKVEFEEVDNICLLITTGLYKLANEHLHPASFGSQIKVKHEMFASWQKLITIVPPLILQSIIIYNTNKLSSFKTSEIQQYWQTQIRSNFTYTAIPFPLSKPMEQILESKKGFNDLHIHLNGSVEADTVWLDFLSNPYQIYKNLKLGFLNQKVAQQFEQESFLLNPLKFFKLICIARKLRQVFYLVLFSKENISILNNSTNRLLVEIVYSNKYETGYQNFQHPFKKLIPPLNTNESELSVEAMMYVIIFKELEDNKRESLATLFHFYLLIKGLCNRLLVQQVHQNGFDQFQMHTLNKLREFTEETYHQRFLQMHGNNSNILKILEGRFSPKSSKDANILFIKSIMKGWSKLTKSIPSGYTHPTLKLIAHFIKKADDNKCKWVKHRTLRFDIFKKAAFLNAVQREKIFDNLVGIDAAANELDTPPEVFAPVFRMMRKEQKYEKFTYHVGEDFYHIISGLRAIFEAVEFLGLKEGDRLGHVTAAGIDPNIWLDIFESNIFISKGEWLDNLVFVRYVMHTYMNLQLDVDLENIEIEIEQLILEIYGEAYLINDYTEAWRMRKFCPILAFCDTIDEAKDKEVFDRNEWREINAEVSPLSKKILKMYHYKAVRKKYNEIISISKHEIFDFHSITSVQKCILELITKKGIVIEVLPTSNVRISNYENYDHHHIFRWKQFETAGLKVPNIILGSDDTGIFATNIFNEYAHIYIQALKESHIEADEFVERLLDNADKCHF